MIRKAELDDRIAMVRMARSFVEATGKGLPFDPAYAERSAKEWIDAPDRLALVLDLGRVRGMLCGSAFLSPLVPMKLAYEQVLWIDPIARGSWAIKLIRSYEEWAKEQGCAGASLATIQEKGADKLYERLGYERAETHFMKVF